MRILLLCDQYPLPPRIINMKNSIQKYYPKSEITIFAWNRNSTKISEEDVISLDMNIGYGNQIKKILYLPKVYFFIKKLSKNKKFSILHAIDFELMFLSSIIKTEEKLVYEVYDIKFLANRVLNTIRYLVEKRSVNRKVDAVIFASPYFKNYYDENSYSIHNYIVVNNKPIFHEMIDKDSGYMNPYTKEIQKKIVISFVGLLRYPEILKKLMNVINKQENILLLFAGSGPAREELEKHAKAIKMSNLIFTGRYSNIDLKSIYDVTDAIWAAYPNNDLNVKYAVSNKYFESQLFKRKIIVSDNTYLGNEVASKGLGLCVDPYSEEDIRRVILSISKLKYISPINEEKFWQNEEKYIEKIYNKLMMDEF